MAAEKTAANRIGKHELVSGYFNRAVIKDTKYAAAVRLNLRWAQGRYLQFDLHQRTGV